MDRFGMVNLEGRAQLFQGELLWDVERASGGALPADPMALLGRWEQFVAWAADQPPRDLARPAEQAAFGPCVPRPAQVFAIGLNYKDHAAEAGLPLPEAPMVFTKFPSCLAGPCADVPLTSDRVDWEVELVVVIGEGGLAIPRELALSRIAGLCVGQDVSDRRLQFRDNPPQFSLGKSAPAFGPLGPAVVPLSCIADPHDLRLTCDVNGERMQDSRSSEMVFGIDTLVEQLSLHCELRPGDLIFTGTPAGVGSVRTPRRYLEPGDLVASEIEGLGRLLNRCVGPR